MKKIMKIFLTILIVIVTVNIAQSQDKRVYNHLVYVYKANTNEGKEVSLEDYKGKVLLIVNVASRCGYTPQYKGLQELYDKYKDKGFEILAFPCNQFSGQEPGTNKEIREFCTKEFGVTFPLFSKIEVNGEDAHPLFQYLTGDGNEPIRWNFEKFLIDRKGMLAKRFGTKIQPKDIEADIEKLLGN